ncbi:unnamed protein product (macronuclear) [Paramecium tetraurelia]|uniref:Beta'-coat protein n=1 Tax=Paramecium tetraurelia TaxID=5888 RepID=A0CRE9_PARTE|nr:uncharacterized protein GSPATT00009681001 [Paramecium tetraurelia]CAK73366.1 unnamed protein product [Paramecium tetraurelia]|eukprot:XP_001440763.1 hypothetical protein (macronuclear) [Paramecium tetraurelia strain d4-2]
MIVKFHKKTERIKGLSFHPKQPWLLVGLHSGEIQMIDYRFGRTINEFYEHEGPVRSVQFHQSLCLFISGSDDFTVRVWNYKTKKCQFVLRGHLDFVRCVNFHPELPWCVSGSDDQTSRIWNYQSRQMIATVTGHSHYVMHCEFHPSKDFMITCSLDQTIRLWSIAQLKKKFTSKSIQLGEQASELELVQILEGHSQGVNWCSFNPKDNTILSSSDDKKIKVWKYFDTRGYEVDQYCGHTNNVSCAMFHPFGEYFISNSEDKTLRLWDMKKKVEVDCFTNHELDRFWICAVHQSNNYFAGGSDSALYIFTLFKNRPAIDLVNNNFVYFGNRKVIKILDLQNGSEKTIKNLQELSCVSDNLLQDNAEQVLHNIYENQKSQILVRLRNHIHNKSKGVSKYLVFEQQTNLSQFFLAKSAIFIGKSKILRSKENSEIEIYNFETDSHILLGHKTDRLFTFTGGKAIYYSESMINVLDPIANKIINQIACTNEFQNIRQVKVNDYCILIQTKNGIYIFTKEFQTITHISEKINIKSVLFLSDQINIILYSTKMHLKYLLLNGDTGIICSMETVPYLVSFQNISEKPGFQYKLFYMDNMDKLLNITVECSEIFFKYALIEKNLQFVQNFIKNHQKLGDLIIAYLFQKGYSILAHQLVTDKRAKFQLALSSNNLEIAYRTCEDLKNPKCYQMLLEEAMRQGNHNIYEVCQQKLRASQELAFLYIITGQLEKINIISNIAQEQNNLDLRFQTLLTMDSLKQRISFLKGCSLEKLANLSQMAHGLEFEANKNCAEDIEWIQSLKPEAIITPQPIIKSSQHPLFSMNWPHNFVDEDEVFKLSGDDSKVANQSKAEITNTITAHHQNPFDKNTQAKQKINQNIDKTEENDEQFQDCQWDLDEVELLENNEQSQATLDQKAILYGYPDYKKALQPVEYLITEQYQQSLQVLQQNYNFVSLTPCQDYLKQLALRSVVEIPQIPFLLPSPLIVSSSQDKIYVNKSFNELLKVGYKHTSDGKFQDALNTFKSILKQAIFQSLNNDVVPICLNYIMAMKCELAKKDKEISRQIELSCYMAMCDLQPVHRSLTLRAAMSLSYKNKNYLTGSQVAQQLIKLLEQAPKGAAYSKPEVLENVKKIYNNCQQNPKNEYNINFEPFYLKEGVKNLCADTLTYNDDVQQIYFCSFDKSRHSSKGILCQVCELCKIN